MDVMDPQYLTASFRAVRRGEAFRAWNIHEAGLGQAKHILPVRPQQVRTYIFARSRNLSDISCYIRMTLMTFDCELEKKSNENVNLEINAGCETFRVLCCVESYTIDSIL